MEKNLQLAYEDQNRDIALKIGRILGENGFEVELVQKDIDPKRLTLILINIYSKEETLFSSLPWLKDQFGYSSLKGFRLFPILAYSPSKEDPEVLFEGELGELYENVFSGEFKPFGWNEESSVLDPEFKRILEESYSE